MNTDDILKSIKIRIFEQGIASDGQPIGIKADGTPTRLVNTGNLRDSLRIDYENNVVSIGFKNEQARTIAAANEKRYGKRIFAPTKAEATAILRLLVAGKGYNSLK